MSLNTERREISFIFISMFILIILSLYGNAQTRQFSNNISANNSSSIISTDSLKSITNTNLNDVNMSSNATGMTMLIIERNITNSIGMEFVLIPAGEYDMGSQYIDYWDSGVGPIHPVKLKKSFYLGKYEVTQKQWREVMGTNPSRFKGDDLPVESISWDDAQEFVKKLNKKEGLNKYRLPSEAEWEYAARAGTTTRLYFGDEPFPKEVISKKSKKPPFNNDENLGLSDYEWYGGNSELDSYKCMSNDPKVRQTDPIRMSCTHPVGKKKPNPW